MKYAQRIKYIHVSLIILYNSISTVYEQLMMRNYITLHLKDILYAVLYDLDTMWNVLL